MRISNRVSHEMLFEDGIPTIFEESGKKGIKMGNGERIVPSIYDSIKELDMPTFQYSVELDGKFGVLEIDFNGNVATKLEIEYDLFQYIKYGEYYSVRKNNKYGIWHNDLCLPCEYDEIRVFENNDLLLCKDGKYGMWDWHIYVPCEYDEITFIEYEKKQILGELEWDYHDNYLLLRKGNKYGLWSIDTKLLPTIYDEIAPPIDGWGIRVKKDGVWGYLNKNNDFTTDISEVPLKWENLDDIDGGINI